MNKPHLILGSDHAGYPLKQIIIRDYLQKNNFLFDDMGCYSQESCDYPIFAHKVCQKVLNNEGMGILICGSGIGMSMSANRYKGIRAALCHNEYLAQMSRKHNKANVLCLGSRVIGQDLALSILETFIFNNFEGDRHQKRIDLMDNLTTSYSDS